jgi:hypothetical protein
LHKEVDSQITWFDLPIYYKVLVGLIDSPERAHCMRLVWGTARCVHAADRAGSWQDCIRRRVSAAFICATHSPQGAACRSQPCCVQHTAFALSVVMDLLQTVHPSTMRNSCTALGGSACSAAALSSTDCGTSCRQTMHPSTICCLGALSLYGCVLLVT